MDLLAILDPRIWGG